MLYIFITKHLKSKFSVVVVQLVNSIWIFATPWMQYARLHCPQRLLEFAQIHVHWVNDAIQPSHPLTPPSSPAFNISQNQGLFQWVSSSHQVAKVSASVLPVNIQGRFSFELTSLISLLSKGLSGVLLQHHNLKASIFQPSAFFISTSHIHTLLLEKP